MVLFLILSILISVGALYLLTKRKSQVAHSNIIKPFQRKNIFFFYLYFITIHSRQKLLFDRTWSIHYNIFSIYLSSFYYYYVLRNLINNKPTAIVLLKRKHTCLINKLNENAIELKE